MIITDDITIISVNTSADNKVAGGKYIVCGQIHQVLIKLLKKPQKQN